MTHRLAAKLLVIMFTIRADDETILNSLLAGACLYVIKRRTSPEELARALTDVPEGRPKIARSF